MGSIDYSVVIPVYGSPGTLVELHRRLTEALSSVASSYEILMVEDASPDNSWEIIQRLASTDPHLHGIKLSRNFGQHAAITAGLNNCVGNWIIVMDCDLQDLPEEIPNLIQQAQLGFEQVVGLREDRADGRLKRIGSRLFFGLLSYLTGERLDARIGNFGIYKRPVIDAILSMGDTTRTFTILTRWVGFARSELPVQHGIRPHGRSSYSLRKLISLGLRTILGSSEKPLRLTVVFGMLVSFVSLLFTAWLVLRWWLWGGRVVGWTSTAVLLSFLSGTIIGSIGIVGLYVGRIFEQTKNRPVFVIDQQTSS